MFHMKHCAPMWGYDISHRCVIMRGIIVVYPVWVSVDDGGSLWGSVGIHFPLVGLVTLAIMSGKVQCPV